MGKTNDPKISKPIIRDPDPAGTPIERKDPPHTGKNEPEKSEIVGRHSFEQKLSLSRIGNGDDG